MLAIDPHHAKFGVGVKARKLMVTKEQIKSEFTREQVKYILEHHGGFACYDSESIDMLSSTLEEYCKTEGIKDIAILTSLLASPGLF